ncbi:MAG: nitronate monooxygenase [Terrimesophilobacter sp.]
MSSKRLDTLFCGQAGVRYPVVQAPMGNAASPELAAAVSNAGGLGMLALSWTELEDMRTRVRDTKALTGSPFGVNVVLEWQQQERIEICLDEGVRIISTFWGDPKPYVELIHEAGALHIHTVGSAEDARRCVDAGVDMVIAQGWEAGGHVWGGVSTLVLVPAVVDAVAPVPVLAAGGITDGRGLAAVLALGASAAVMGTRFLMSKEANVRDDVQDSLIAASETDTALGPIFDGGWPNAKHRVIRNDTVRRWEAAGRPSKPNRPGEGDIVAHDPDGVDIMRYDDIDVVPGLNGGIDALPLYGGQSAGLIHSVLSAGDIIRKTIAEAGTILA